MPEPFFMPTSTIVIELMMDTITSPMRMMLAWFSPNATAASRPMPAIVKRSA